jgi:3-phosphoshikimate 1-carboxyvinyltransferase
MPPPGIVNRTLTIRPAASVRGRLAPPGDKSLSHRYAILGAIAHGTTSVDHLAPGADVTATIDCLRTLGAAIDRPAADAIRVRGRGRSSLSAPLRPLDAGNSGTTLRLLAGVVAGCPFRSILTGDASLQRRPMRRVIDPLTAMGARIEALDGRAPLAIDGGRLTAVAWRSPVASAQVKSAILLAGLAADGVTSIAEPLPTRDHTERAFRAFGLEIVVDGLECAVRGGQEPTPPDGPLTVPGDPSSAAVFAAAAAALPGSRVRLDGVCLNPRRLGFMRALERLGAEIEIMVEGERGGEPVGALVVSYGEHRAAVIEPTEVPSLIDELPVLAARAALGGGLEVTGAAELRVKESDRITALVVGLRALGVAADERPDGFAIDGRRQPIGGTVDAAGDHRLVLAFAVVGLGAAGPVTITGADVVAVSYPDFARDLASVVA